MSFEKRIVLAIPFLRSVLDMSPRNAIPPLAKEEEYKVPFLSRVRAQELGTTLSNPLRAIPKMHT
jgi:hypothetical protein